MNARTRLRNTIPTSKPRIYTAIPDSARGGYWVERFAKTLDLRFAGTFDEALTIANQWAQEAA